MGFAGWLLAIQAFVYLSTGLWPIVHLQSFEAVTGPKVDKWLVKTVGMLAASIGLGLALALWRGSVSRDLAAVALSAAVGFAVVDVVYAAKRRIRTVYLADAVLEIAIAIGWLFAWPRAS